VCLGRVIKIGPRHFVGGQPTAGAAAPSASAKLSSHASHLGTISTPGGPLASPRGETSSLPTIRPALFMETLPAADAILDIRAFQKGRELARLRNTSKIHRGWNFIIATILPLPLARPISLNVEANR